MSDQATGIEVSEALVESLRDFEWAGSCSPNRPRLDSPEWARMRLEAILPAIEASIRERLLSDEALTEFRETLPLSALAELIGTGTLREGLEAAVAFALGGEEAEAITCVARPLGGGECILPASHQGRHQLATGESWGLSLEQEEADGA